MTHEEILSMLGDYVDYLIANSSAEAPMWNIEKVRSGKPNKWNYIDGCMITACLSLYHTTGDKKYLDFSKQFIDYFVQPDGSIQTYDPKEYNLDNVNQGKNLFVLYDLYGEEKGELFYYEMFRLLGACEDTWSAYKKYIDRYMMYLHDIRAFVPTIRNFIKFILSTLTTNGPESYAAALYGFYNDDRTAEKLIVNPITYHGDCYRRHDEYMLSYVPRELPDGSMAICQEHVTDSLQALMKADYMLALNSGHNIRRCIICGKYFMLKSGVHALYCEGACPHAPGYTCRQFGTVEVQKELAKNNPKVKAKLTAFSRITKDMQRGAISQEDARRVKDHVRDRLYDALRSPDISVEEFSEQISTAQVYEYCRITRVSKPRGRPPKAKAGGTHDQ